MSGKIRLLLKDSMSKSNVYKLSVIRDWLWLERVPQSDSNPYEEIWVKDVYDDQTSIHYLEDHWIDLRYLVARGPDAEEVAQQILSSLEIVDAQEVLRSSPIDLEAEIKAVYQIGILAPQAFTQNFFEYLESKLTSKEVSIRKAAIIAVAYIGWSEFKPIVRVLKESDPEPEIREDASRLLDGFDEVEAEE